MKSFKAKSEWGMFAFSIWALELELFGVNLLIVLPFCQTRNFLDFAVQIHCIIGHWNSGEIRCWF